jgi:alpha-tubulin suppressor-like RCC1 family protein
MRLFCCKKYIVLIVYIIGTDNAVSAAAQTPVTNTPNVDGKTYKRLQVGQSFDAVEFFRNLSDLPSGNVTNISVYDEKIAHVSGDSVIADRWGKTPVTANVNGKFYVFHLEVRPAGAVAMPMIVTTNLVVDNKGVGGYALKADGTLWIFHPQETNSLPKQISGSDNIIQITASQQYAYALKSDGTVWQYKIVKPIYAEQLPDNETGANIVAISNKTFNGMGPAIHAICSDGRLIGYGKNSNYSSLGYDGTETIWNYVAGGESGTEYMENVVSVSGMGMSSYVLKADGSAYIWGFDGGGSLGYKSNQPPQRIKAGDAPSVSGYLENVVMLYGAGGYAVFLTAVLSDGKGYKAGQGVGQNFVLMEASSANPETKITEIGLYGGKAWESYRGGIALMSDNTCWDVITGDKVDAVKGFTELSSPGESGAIIAGVKEDGSVWWLGDGLNTPVAIMEKESTGIGASGHEAHLEIQHAELTRDNQSENVRLYNDNIMRADDTVMTAIQLGDTLRIDAASITGYNSSGDTGSLFYLFEPEKVEEETYVPTGIEFSSYNEDVAVVDSSTGVITPKKVGITYIIVKDGKGSVGSFRLNIIPKNNAFIAYPQLTGGHMSGMALKADGTVWTWGNSEFSLGTGEAESISVIPVQVIHENGSPLENIVRISASGTMFVAVDKYGKVWMWGGNKTGQMAQGNTNKEIYWYPVRPKNEKGTGFLDEDYRIIQAEANGLTYGGASGNITVGSVLFLDANGNIYGVGYNNNSVLGIGTDNKLLPINLTKSLGLSTKVKAITRGEHRGNSKFLRNDGKMVGWGGNYYGDLGVAIGINSSVYVEPCVARVNSHILELFNGIVDTAVITVDGDVYFWGHDYQSCVIGGGLVNAMPKKVAFSGSEEDGSKPLFNYTARNLFTLKSNGFVYTIGSNVDGNIIDLGHGTKARDRVFAGASPDENNTGYLNNVIAMGQEGANYGGAGTGLAVRSDGSVWSWGGGTKGQLGNGGIVTSSTPVRVGEKPYLEISGATLNGGAIEIYDGTIKKTDGTLVSAVQIDDVIAVTDVAAVKSFNVFESSFKPSGVEYTIYNPDSGVVENLGSGRFRAKKTGVTYIIMKYEQDGEKYIGSFRLNVVPAGDNIAYPKVTGGADAVYALKADGSVWAWGTNVSRHSGITKGGGTGKLGTGTPYGTSTVPVRVVKEDSSPLEDIIEIASHGVGGYALDKTGHVWAWGATSTGALGQGEPADKKTKTRIPYAVKMKNSEGTGYLGDDKKIVHIADWSQAGYMNAAADDASAGLMLDEKGDVYASCYPSFKSNRVYSSPPTNISLLAPSLKGSKNISKMSSSKHVILKRDGSIYTWGQNANNYYGDNLNNKNLRCIPIVDTETNEDLYIIYETQFNDTNNMAIAYNGDAYMWGTNRSGALALETTTGVTKPTKSDGYSKDANGVVPLLASGTNESMVLMSNGQIYTAGKSDNLALGQGTSGAADGVAAPVQDKDGNPLTGVVLAESGAAYNNGSGSNYKVDVGYAVKNDGSVWSWGYQKNDDEAMMLGDESLTDPGRAYADRVLSQYGENHLEVSGGTLLRGSDTYPVTIHEGTLTIGGGMRSAVCQGDELSLDINSLIGCLL